MNSQSEEVVSSGPSSRDTAVLVLAILLLVGGMVAFYYFQSQYNVLIRALMLLGATVAAIVLAAQTMQGRDLWKVLQGANVERRKVVWPTRQESVQTTLLIALVVAAFGALLALIDWGLNSGVHYLLGAKG